MVLKLSVAAGGGSSGQTGNFGWDVLATKLGIGEKNLQNTSEVTMGPWPDSCKRVPEPFKLVTIMFFWSVLV